MKGPSITIIGSLNMDIVVEADRLPELGETVSGRSVHFIPGGKGGNQAVAAARLGAEVDMIAFIGNDAFGETLIQSLTSSGVLVKRIKQVEETSTGMASILLAEDDNQIVVVPGANAYCLPESIEDLEQSIAASDLVLMQLEIPLETVSAAAELAEKHSKPVILNPAPAAELPQALLKRVNYITPNLSELYLLTGLDPNSASLEEAMDALLEQGPECVVATLGSEGSAFKRKGDILKKVPAHKVPIVDTTGAGDAFNAGLAFGISSGYSLEQAVTFAGSVSALAVSAFGAQTGMPSIEAVNKFIYSLTN
ncbi:ribokinase [Paenibacillus sp. GXUN7292]|uniref:ribokinase n=1 Tax=Paenibacillus sp. GXUN7292 TaxID=3422499 RepID=UPI003D7F1012